MKSTILASVRNIPTSFNTVLNCTVWGYSVITLDNDCINTNVIELRDVEKSFYGRNKVEAIDNCIAYLKSMGLTGKLRLISQ